MRHMLQYSDRRIVWYYMVNNMTSGWEGERREEGGGGGGTPEVEHMVMELIGSLD